MKHFYLVWKNLWRKKIRTTLTVLSIFIAFVLFGLLRALEYAFTLGVDLADADRLVTIHKMSIIQSLPYSYYGRVRNTDGVADVTHASWFGGYYQDQRNQFPQFPVDGETYLRIYPELVISDDEKQAWLENRTGTIVGRALADRYDWKVGDRIPIQATIWTKADGGRVWEFVIDGIFDTDDPRGTTAFMLFHYDYFNETRAFARDRIGWMILRVADSSQSPAVAAAIDVQFQNSPAETKTSTEAAFSESFAKQLGDIGMIVVAILGPVLLTILLVAGNTMAQTVRERIPELAVLKTLGFTDGNVLKLVLSESILIALFGGLIGLGVSWLAVGALAKAFAAFLPGLYLPAGDVLLAILLMLGVGFAAGIFPALQAQRLTIAQALGGRL